MRIFRRATPTSPQTRVPVWGIEPPSEASKATLPPRLTGKWRRPVLTNRSLRANVGRALHVPEGSRPHAYSDCQGAKGKQVSQIGCSESNQDSQSQSLLSYLWTTPE